MDGSSPDYDCGHNNALKYKAIHHIIITIISENNTYSVALLVHTSSE